MRTGGWEVDAPPYRVYFWRETVGPNGPGVASSPYLITDAHDVSEVLEWAEREVGPHRTYTVYAEVDRGDTKGLLRLIGVDPTRSDGVGN